MLYKELTSEYIRKTEEHIEGILSKEKEEVYGMLIPFIKRGGKRVRPALLFTTALAIGENPEEIVHHAAIIEMFHNFTLIHDDIEDDSKVRRGEPTLHITHTLPVALNSGDALYTLVWENIINIEGNSGKKIEVMKAYAKHFKRVVEGQGMELDWYRTKKIEISEEEYLEMIGGKTASLISLSTLLPALIFDKKEFVDSLKEYGYKIGLAFQIVDDVLNIVGDFDKYQKEIGGDIVEGKRTLMITYAMKNGNEEEKAKIKEVILKENPSKEEVKEVIEILKKTGAVEYAKEKAKRYVDEAKKTIEKLPDSKAKDALIELADYMITRER